VESDRRKILTIVKAFFWLLYDENETEILLAFRLMVVTSDLVELGMPSLVRIFVPSYLHCKSVQYA
jgi:hypothetical protein